MNQYEAMFLFDPTYAADMEKARHEIDRILGRAEGRIVFCERWDERKLAYEIKGRKRGCYILTYFEASGNRIAGIERDVKISETVLRILIKRADGVTPEQMQRLIPTGQEEEEPQEESPRRERRTRPSRDGDEERRPREKRPVAVGAMTEDSESGDDSADSDESNE